ncbi:MAG: hypothetical protein J6V20_01560 [Bacteroidaceae bacterium]|nr:hypothetical protein [Bacteroidaceae bacterium]
MTYEEALDWCEQFIDNLVSANVDTKRRTLGLQAMKKCKQAIEKQMRRKPIYWNNKMYICPNCHRAEYIKQRDGLDVYCGGCGQLIDWSE